MCRILVQHLEAYSSQKKDVSNHIPSKYEKQMSRKSKVVSKSHFWIIATSMVYYVYACMYRCHLEFYKEMKTKWKTCVTLWTSYMNMCPQNPLGNHSHYLQMNLVWKLMTKSFIKFYWVVTNSQLPGLKGVLVLAKTMLHGENA